MSIGDIIASMKILMIALNSKFIHSNLAVHSLSAYVAPLIAETETPLEIEILELTINQQEDELLREIYEARPDLLCFSCYIWNIEKVLNLTRECRKVMPEIDIFLGGPEVSYDGRKVLEEHSEITGVMVYEGEETFQEVVEVYLHRKDFSQVKGIVYRDGDEICENQSREVMDLSRVPFVYQDASAYEHKIIYYESSRGCPFACSYCLSSLDKKLRFRDLSLVKEELAFFLENRVRQVKFVDRTFNCNKKHALSILTFIKEHDNGYTNFHFEVSADLLDEEFLNLLRGFRPGCIQFEVGVQSTNPKTLREIRRQMDFHKVAYAVKAIGEMGNIHLHLDLIAGLPFEDFASFRNSFDMVYHLEPEQLQLGFLKVLKGTYMEERAADYGLIYKSTPPYEVLGTKWLSYEEILLLKQVEEVVEIYYNSGQFLNSVKALARHYESPFSLYLKLGAFYHQRGHDRVAHKRSAVYEIFLDFIATYHQEEVPLFRELLTLDYYAREQAKSRPDFAFAYALSKEQVKGYFKDQDRRQLHLEYFPVMKKVLIFDYKRRNPMDGNAYFTEVSPDLLGI